MLIAAHCYAECSRHGYDESARTAERLLEDIRPLRPGVLRHYFDCAEVALLATQHESLTGDAMIDSSALVPAAANEGTGRCCCAVGQHVYVHTQAQKRARGPVMPDSKRAVGIEPAGAHQCVHRNCNTLGPPLDRQKVQ